MTKMFTEDSDILLVQFRKILTLGETWLIEELCRTVIEAGIIVLLNNKTTMSSWDEEEQKIEYNDSTFTIHNLSSHWLESNVCWFNLEQT